MELGYRLKRSLWGRGLATEGSSALLRKGFEEMKYPKICARTLVHNLASQRVMQKIGLHFERHFTYPPEIIPGWSETDRSAIKYSLTAEQYTTLINGN
jgi:RimJ/RimL family protein N-acetyltransferase